MKFIPKRLIHAMVAVVMLFYMPTFYACNNDDPEDEPPVFEAHYTHNDSLILSYVNNYRSANGEKLLIQNDVLWVVANEHSKDMLSGTVSIGHDGFDSRVEYVQKWMKPKGWGHVGENVAYLKIDDLSNLVGYWLSSATHKANLEDNYSYASASCIPDSLNDYCYVTLIFYE